MSPDVKKMDACSGSFGKLGKRSSWAQMGSADGIMRKQRKKRRVRTCNTKGVRRLIQEIREIKFEISIERGFAAQYLSGNSLKKFFMYWTRCVLSLLHSAGQKLAQLEEDRESQGRQKQKDVGSAGTEWAFS